MPFDVSQFLVPYGGDPLGGLKMQQRATEQGSAQLSDALQAIVRTQLARRELAQQRAIAEAQLGQRAAAQSALGAARTEAGQRAKERLELDVAKFKADQARDRGAADSAALQMLLDPLRAGDQNALAAAQARVQAQDPSLQVLLPGQAAPAMAPGIFGVDEVFGAPSSLRVNRGQSSLLDSDAEAVREAERQAFANTIDPLMGSRYAPAYAPAVEAGRSAAGSGMTGAAAAEMARDQANKEANRGVQETMAGSRIGETQAQHSAQNQFRLHQAIQGVGNMAAVRHKVPEIQKDAGLIGEIRMQLDSGMPMAENQALKGLLMRYTGKAMSNAEARQAESSAGQWVRLEKLLRQWTAGGALPADFKEQMQAGLESIDRYNRIRLHKAGIAARDAMYSSTELPMDIDQMVRAGNQVYTGITGVSLSPEQLAQEKQRLLRLSGANPMDLGVTNTPGPKVNQVVRQPSPAAPVVPAEEKEAQEYLKLLESYDANP